MAQPCVEQTICVDEGATAKESGMELLMIGCIVVLAGATWGLFRLVDSVREERR